MLWMRLLGVSTTAASAGTALVLGFVLIGAWLAGDALRWLRMPRLTGYLLFGVAIGPYAGNLVTGAMASQLQVVAGIATTLIALIAGLTLSVERLGPRFAPIARFTGITVVVPLALIFGVAWAGMAVAAHRRRGVGPAARGHGAACSPSSSSASRPR